MFSCITRRFHAGDGDGQSRDSVDDGLLQSQAEFSHASFKELVDSMGGEGVGGGAMTIGYGFWALELARART